MLNLKLCSAYTPASFRTRNPRLVWYLSFRLVYYYFFKPPQRRSVKQKVFCPQYNNCNSLLDNSLAHRFPSCHVVRRFFFVFFIGSSLLNNDIIFPSIHWRRDFHRLKNLKKKIRIRQRVTKLTRSHNSAARAKYADKIVSQNTQTIICFNLIR